MPLPAESQAPPTTPARGRRAFRLPARLPRVDLPCAGRVVCLAIAYFLAAKVSLLLAIPPGVAHGVKNLAASRGRIIYLVDFHFSPDPDQTEEGRLPWDFAGPEIWDVTRG